ncbi:DUF1659 domain-containing protein [Mycoplasmatota bacterium]|nr:DUF1659 domain-containing protein [Mycoplasmatota bacterium]
MMNKEFDGKTLILVLDNGVDGKGNPVYSRKSIKNIRETATEQQIYDVGNSLAPLFSQPISNICVDEDYVLAAI